MNFRPILSSLSPEQFIDTPKITRKNISVNPVFGLTSVLSGFIVDSSGQTPQRPDRNPPPDVGSLELLEFFTMDILSFLAGAIEFAILATLTVAPLVHAWGRTGLLSQVETAETSLETAGMDGVATLTVEDFELFVFEPCLDEAPATQNRMEYLRNKFGSVSLPSVKMLPASLTPADVQDSLDRVQLPKTVRELRKLCLARGLKGSGRWSKEVCLEALAV